MEETKDKSYLDGWLERKIESCKHQHETMKAVNEYYRKHGTVIGCPAVSEEKAAELDEDIRRRYPIHKQPYMSSALRSKLNEIRRWEKSLNGGYKKNDERGR